ncbi:glycosyltransferase, partial [Umezakia ovalisporum]|uniref:glycosyltransferase n=1 Tax=Umezakia ovalisporum TaxID=75695 RepID=UPI0039C62699
MAAAAVQMALGKRCTVTFVGSIEERNTYYKHMLQSEATQFGVNVVFTGAISEEQLVEQYKACNAYVCLSEHEGFGMTVFEAMYFGVPVVVWGTSALIELCKHHPLVISTYDISSFAAAIAVSQYENFKEDIINIQYDMLKFYNKSVVA